MILPCASFKSMRDRRPAPPKRSITLALPLPDGSAADKVVIDRVLDRYVEDGFTPQEKGIG